MSSDDVMETKPDAEDAKPRLVLMGEFSAGKSTLTNILLDGAPLPMRVTATRLPPVRLSYGEPAAYAVGKDGGRQEIELEDMESISLDETAMVDIRMQSDVLQLCDLLDMPGISDPNMPQDMWEDVIEANDRVIWCTHATQAWRQSEAAIWEILRHGTSGENLLLITQFDKLQNERDRERVLKRVERETAGLFAAVYPVSLLEAMNAGDDAEAWEESGAAALSEHVVQFLMQRKGKLPFLPGAAPGVMDAGIRDAAAVQMQEPAHPKPEDSAGRVVPRRVVSNPARSRRQRPDHEGGSLQGR
ncbi:dynamin family protein [Sulfitobacter sp. D35]|uniref:dynamin family protein n=1 Tax=Sulfitobacter sp. D35 TaxID=3083252 RepID=UPI00296ECD9C|nr:dynamin family protein [Sulfitobacter sp. D35]MDW4497155.1 dynamin family protein [Sulfitobacter sp. D35]